MNHFEVEKALKTMVVYCDSREQPTVRAKRRLEMIGLPVERKALPFGDYSAYCTLPNGEHYSLEDEFGRAGHVLYKGATQIYQRV